MKYFRSIPHLGKVCALATTNLILPVLAHAQQQGQGPGGQQPIPVMPEMNPAWVLVPFLAAVLVFSSRHLFGRKARKHDT
jgi:hypothetical protein